MLSTRSALPPSLSPGHRQASRPLQTHRNAAAILLAAAAAAFPQAAQAEDRHPPVELFVDAASPDEQKAERALGELDEWWRDDYACILVDIARLMQPRGGVGRRGRRGRRQAEAVGRGGFGSGGAGDGVGGFDNMGLATFGREGGELPTIQPLPREHPSTRVRERLVRFLEAQTGQQFGDDLGAWRRWYWNLPYAPHPDYLGLKAALYTQVDESMAQLFRAAGAPTVRLDEIDWNGMDPDRIPVLDHPKHVPSTEAHDLKDDQLVLGIDVGGEARAYPQRILVRHELALDRLGETELTIVTDVLCGTVVAYVSETHGSRLTFKPSGLVYRSNRLIYDEESASLWSTIEGRPVFGPLTLHDVELRAHPAVITTWREWKALHPDTTVLSFDTGYSLDYSRETLFRRYLRSDRLVFGVPRRDERLKTKEPVLGLLLRPAGESEGGQRSALAIRAKLLEKKQNRVYHHRFAGRELVVVSSRDGAHRVYDAGEIRFVARDRDGRLRDASGGHWSLSETALTPEAPDTAPRTRIPARRAFWFAWHAQFPETELVK